MIALVDVNTRPLGNLNPALLFGLIILGGAFGSRLFQKLHIPQVVGCIVVGILLGDILGIITQHTIEKLEPFTMFALGVIGFMIGSELRGDVFKKYGKQFFAILFSQGFGAFLLVVIGGSLTAWLALPAVLDGIGGLNRIYASIAMGLVLGAIASATFIMEIFGPMLVKAGIQKAGEVGLNVTEEDLIGTYTVKDVMDAEPTSIAQNLPLHQILEVFSTSESVYYPVIDNESRITGIITIAAIKEMFANQDVAGWLPACDVAGPVRDKTTSYQPPGKDNGIDETL